jgi:hypothetical protein
MKRSLNQSGFGLVPVLFLVVVVAAVAVIGYRISNKTQVASSVPAIALSTKAPVTIKDAAGLQKASDSLTGNLDTTSLDADLNSLL